MKRFLCGLLAVCSLFTTALADIAQQLLWAEEVAQELDESVVAYAALYEDDEGLAEAIAEGDYSCAAVIYRYDIDMSDLYAANGVQDATLMRYMDLDLWDAMVIDGMGLNYVSAAQVAVLYESAVRKPFIGSCGREWWVLSYWNGFDILVQFMDQGNGTVLVSALYMPRKFGPADMMTLFEFYGIHATYEKIR